jgi:heat shock protein HslJ
MKKILFVLSGSVIVALVLAACGAPSASLTGTTWKLTSYGRVDSLSPVVADSEGTITFGTEGKLTGVGACNRFEGDYTVKGNQIVLNPLTWDVGGNKFCPEPQMSQESGVWDVLQGTVDFKIEGNTLTVTRPLTETDALVLVFEATANNAKN